jgi:dienelactone hydrolase
MKKCSLFVVSVLALASFLACNSKKTSNTETVATASSDTSKTNAMIIKEDSVTYTDGTTSMHGYIAYDSASMAKRPVVLVVHEWWGVGDYVRKRAAELANLGYIAMAIDMYGNGAQGTDPDMAGKLAMPFYKDPQLAKKRFDAALAKIKTYPQADTSQIAAIGYCFGGAQVLNMARMGENLVGVVSFHGNLVGVTPDKEKLKAKILICHGEADKFVSAEEVAKFKKQMDSIGVAYTFKSYPNATHAFTNPEATEKGKKFKMPIEYNAAADTASWNDMKTFFAGIFK